MKKVYVLGGAQTDFERNWSKEGKGVIALLKEVMDDGLKSIDLSYDELARLNREKKIACFVGNFIAEHYINQGHLGALLTEVHPAFFGIPCGRYEAACASGSLALDTAISKIKSEDYEIALVIGFELMKTVDPITCGNILGMAALYEKEAKGNEFPFPMLFGKLANNTIDKYGLNKDEYLNDLALISTINYENAKRNPCAQTKKWFMSFEEASKRGTSTNPIIGGLLSVSDCSQVTDGAAFVALASEKYVKNHCLNKKLPIVKGYGHTVAPMLFDKKMENSRDNEYILPYTRQAILDAYERAQLTVEEIDFFETHDCFSSSEYIAISSFGITSPGKEHTAIAEGTIAFNGSKPINPSGGLIGCGHPVGASGVRMFLDLFKQVYRCAGMYQLKKAENGMMLNIGGSATTNFVFIVGKDD